jgi:hypothetical protein
MNEQYFRKGSLWLSVLFIIMLVSGSLASASVSAATQLPNGGMIAGKVTSPAGYPLPAGALVKLFDPGGENVRGQATPDLNDGSFQMGPVPNGLYVLKAIPPASGPFTQSLPRVVSVANAPVDAGALAVTYPQVYGTVTAPNGVTPVDANVTVALGDGQALQQVTASAGQFKVGGLPLGSYWLWAYPLGEEPYWQSQRRGLSISSPTITQTVTLSLREAQIWGHIQDSQGNPVKDALVTAGQPGGEHASDLSGPSGFWSLGGLSAGAYRLTALPPFLNGGLTPPDPLQISLPGASNPYTLTFGTAQKFVEGTVTTNAGGPVSQAKVVARRVDLPGSAETLTAANGTYQLALAPGLWALTVRPYTMTVPAAWLYPQPPQVVFFHDDRLRETRQQDFTILVSDASVSGMVQLPDASPSPFTVTVDLYNDEGIGLRVQTTPGDGTFQQDLPSGSYKVVVHPSNDAFVGPLVDPIVVLANGNFDLGTLTLLARDALITGTLKTTGGQAVEGIPVVAWRAGVPGNLSTTSGPDGQYSLAVSAGAWHVQPAPTASQPYLYSDSGQDVTIESGNTISAIDFGLTAADATINGLLVDPSGQPVQNAEAWAFACQAGAPQIHNGAPVVGGAFSILVPAGTYNVAAHLAAGSPYLSTGERQVSVDSGATTTITLTVQMEDAAIIGGLWDPRQQKVISGVPGLVGAWSGSQWALAPIDAGNGAFHLDLAAGLWRLNYRIDPNQDYVKTGGAVNVPLQTGQKAIISLPVLQKDGSIQGMVLDPEGHALAGITVLANGVGSGIQDLWLHTLSAADGSFELQAPSGRYRLGAAGGDPAWIKPAEFEVVVPPGGASPNNTLQFRRPDATISGTLTVSNTESAGDVYVWAWSDDGGFVNAHFPVAIDVNDHSASGLYQLNLTSGATWHLGAVYETGSQYWLGRAVVTVNGASGAQDLTLDGPYARPAPVVVTFDSSQPQDIQLSDGTRIFIPGGALPVSGSVTLRIVPIATLPRQQHANVLRYGYAFLATDENGQPIEAHFNQDVVIRFSYDPLDLVRWHLREDWLKPAYYSTTTNRWTFPDSYIVDTEAHQVVMQIDHFTNYALTTLQPSSTYLPLTLH